MSDLIQRAIMSLEINPNVIAGDLAAYRTRHRIDNAVLAEWLGVTPDQLHRLALCRRPHRSEPGFEQTVNDIAAYAGCDSTRLTTLLSIPPDDVKGFAAFVSDRASSRLFGNYAGHQAADASITSGG